MFKIDLTPPNRELSVAKKDKFIQGIRKLIWRFPITFLILKLAENICYSNHCFKFGWNDFHCIFRFMNLGTLIELVAFIVRCFFLVVFSSRSYKSMNQKFNRIALDQLISWLFSQKQIIINNDFIFNNILMVLETLNFYILIALIEARQFNIYCLSFLYCVNFLLLLYFVRLS